MYRLIYSITTLLIGYISIYIFDAIIFDITDHQYSFDPVINTMRYDGRISAYMFFSLFVLFSQFFLNKIIKTIKWSIIASILFIISLEEAFFEIAYGLRAEFGPISTNIRFELVLGFKETLVLLSVAIMLYFLLLRFMKNKKLIKTEDEKGLISKRKDS